jgi:N-acetylglucosaminyl-diphospho-decaprenol L-rhamnosyltransferase
VISVIVPAHNEEGRVGRCLVALLDGIDRTHIEVVVVANGCHDDTADEAREFGPPVSVVELVVASKIAALNAGEEVVASFPRFYVDADVVVPGWQLQQVAEPLQRGDVLLAAPQRQWLDAGRPWIVRSYLRLLSQLPQVRSTLMGGGVLGISEEGRRRFGSFPEVIGDDLFLESLFRPDEKAVVAAARSEVEMPRTVAGLVARRTRVVLANREAAESTDGSASRRWQNLTQAIRAEPALIVDLPAFLGVTLAAELQARKALRHGTVAWQRDESTRHQADLGHIAEQTDRAVAAVVVTHNAERSLPPLLASLSSSQPHLVRDVVVVDNGSSDGTVAIARKAPVEVIEQSNTGYAHGVNRGTAAAPEDADILVLNPDVVLHPGAVSRLAAVLDLNADVGIAVPLLVDESGNVAPSLRRRPTVARTLAEAIVGGSRSGRFGESYRPDPDGSRQTADWATGAVMLLRRSMLERIGPLDESFFLYSEETELCLRAGSAGYRTVCEPEAVAIHVGGDMAHDPTLWALRAVNRVRLYQRASGRLRGAMFQAVSLLFELRRVVMGDPLSRQALLALFRPPAVAARQLVAQLGGQTTYVEAPYQARQRR